MSSDLIRVLLVEDDAPLRALTRTALERSGRFRIVGEASEGLTGARMASSLSPDLILLDLAMPIMGGIEALPLIRKAAPSAKVVALSMLQRDRYERMALEQGAFAFIDKGVESRELVRRLLEIMGRLEGAGDRRGAGGGLLTRAVLPGILRIRMPGHTFGSGTDRSFAQAG